MSDGDNGQQAPGTTHFGFEEVPLETKAGRVREVFESVAGRYDLMNDVMSGGLHRMWKRFTLARTLLRPGQSALDVAGGTGDLAAGLGVACGGLLDLHFITDDDIERQTSYAAKIGAISDAALELPLGRTADPV
mgnify:CR=1 FL=1